LNWIAKKLKFFYHQNLIYHFIFISYTIHHAADFNIEFGSKSDLITRVYIKDNIGGL